DRFPVRIRYARDFREDEEKVKQLLVSRSAMPGGKAAMSPGGMKDGFDSRATGPYGESPHAAAGEHATLGTLHIPLGELPHIQIVEGPSMIRSENGRLCRYVTLNVSGERDVVGFVEDAQRAVAEKVPLPEGVHIVWSGEFEHQVRAAATLRIIIPIVFLLIFI